MKLKETRIAIIGLGLMGASLAQALRGHCAALFGVDSDLETVKKAANLDLVQAASVKMEEIIPQADLVIFAAPVRATLGLLGRLSEISNARAVVLDLCSTKAEIVAAMDRLPAHFDPVGGHPMCGKETSGLENADPVIYREAPFAIVPLARSSPAALALTGELVQAIGARPLLLDAATHDAWTAATSHFPYLMAAALVLATPSDAAPLVGSGFRSTARVAGSSVPMMMDILTTNRANVLAAIQRLRESLDGLESALRESESEQELAEALSKARERYQALVGKRD
ncbi:MAG: prephenate dehydrogenase/arogenate dehydrogenase family protein [Anaerolineae bacterium]|nr:prephenate dehydrogenase/arogenate dehydrogenase family protein [Anaerolineae bacterium]